MSKILTLVIIFYLFCKYHIIYWSIPLTASCIRDFCSFSSIDLLKDTIFFFFFEIHTCIENRQNSMEPVALFFFFSLLLPAFHLPEFLFPTVLSAIYSKVIFK